MDLNEMCQEWLKNNEITRGISDEALLRGRLISYLRQHKRGVLVGFANQTRTYRSAVLALERGYIKCSGGNYILTAAAKKAIKRLKP